jgi:hypothetical protein
LLELKKTCKLFFSIISNYVKDFIKKTKIFKNEYKDESKDNKPKIYVYIDKTKKINIEKRYITIKVNNNIIYSYNYFIYIRNLEELYKIFKLNIFKKISLKDLILLYEVYNFSYIINCHEYVKTDSLKVKYTPVFNNMYLYFDNEKKLPTYILEFNCYNKYKLEFIDKILNYICNNNIKIEIIKWHIYLDLNILQKLYINKNIYKIIIDSYINKKYINHKKYGFMFKEKIIGM